jgi:hypothetical protein
VVHAIKAALGRLRQEDYKFEASLVRSYLRKKEKRKKERKKNLIVLKAFIG